MNKTPAGTPATGTSTVIPSSPAAYTAGAGANWGEPHLTRPQPQQPPGPEHPGAGQVQQTQQGQEMRRLLAHLKATLNAAEDALVSVDLDGAIVLWNSCAETLFGYSAAEAIGRPLSVLIPPDRADEFGSVLERVRNGKYADHLETVRTRSDGAPVPVLISVTPVCDDSGELVGMSATVRDITQQKRLEREMRLWRDELQAVARGVDDAVVVRGPDGAIVYANDNAARLLGFNSVGELLASPVIDTHRRFEFYTEAGELVPADRLPGMMALQGIEAPPTVLRFRLLSPSLPATGTGSTEGAQATEGVDRWAVVKAAPIRDQDSGEVKYAASIFSDITERRRAEEALRASEARFQAFMDNSPLVAFIKDEQARFVYVNPRFEQAFQTTAAAVLGVCDTAIVPAEVARRMHEDDALALSSGKLQQLVEVIPGPDGTPHHWLTFKFPLPLLDGKRYLAGASIEITDRVRAEEALKESEARFQAFMHNAPVLAFMKDETGKVVFLNHAWEQLFGMPIAEAIGKDDYQLQPPDLAQQSYEADMEVLHGGQVKVMPETVTAADGTVRHWMTFKFPIVLPSGARYVGGASVEITERVRAEQELQRYAERLRRLSRQLIEAQEAERRRISRDLHDQVGQSLTAIKIDLQIAQQQAMRGALAATPHTTDPVPAEVSNTEVGPLVAGDGETQPVHLAFAQRLGRGIEMVEHTIQQVREFSLDLRPSILDDLGLPSALLWYAEEQARRAGFRARLAVEHFPARLPPELEITCFRVAQEAITNVVRHARASKVSVDLRRSTDELALSVADDGVGFDAQALASDVVGETANGAQGRIVATAHDRIKALGLSGMQERVMLVGGALSIQSLPGAGTTVTAVFPLVGPASAPAGEG